MAITHSTLLAIKATSLSAVVEACGASTKRVGHEFLTQCLWHEDTNPSLTISDQKGFCFCHVCRKSADAIDFVQESKGYTWREAVDFVADVAGIRVETDNEDPEVAARRKSALSAALAKNDSENKIYKENLRSPRANRIRQILKDRGLGREAADEFELGFAPSGFFGGRITIPIYNHRNQLVGWTGRATKAKEEQPAKYKNSSDSDFFNKKLLVFNEPRALKAAREAGSLIFVEGHLDVVNMWQAGIRNVVASQGTGAPDPLVLQRLSRSVKNFILCFDGDAGGIKAAEQFISVAGAMAMKGEISINVVRLPNKQDPDEVIRTGGDLYHYIAEAPNWLDWTIDVWAAALDKDNTAMITQVEEKLRALINGLKSKALRTHYIDRASRVLSNTDKEAKQLAENWGDRYEDQSEKEWQPRTPQQIRVAAERRMMRIYVHRPDKRNLLNPYLHEVSSPALVWLSARLQELSDYCASDLTPHSIMAIIAVAEPHFLQQLRTIVKPNVKIDDSPGVLKHIADIMGRDSTDFDEPDSYQPLT